MMTDENFINQVRWRFPERYRDQAYGPMVFRYVQLAEIERPLACHRCGHGLPRGSTQWRAKFQENHGPDHDDYIWLWICSDFDACDYRVAVKT